MQLNAPTLFVLMVVVMAVVALLLLWAWLQNRSVEALAWWGVASATGSLGTSLVFLRGLIPDWLSVDLANALVILAYGLIWSGVRIFNARTVRASFLLGAAIWLAACQFDAFSSSLPAKASLFSVVAGSYTLLAAWEFLRGTEQLASRSAAVVCMVLHALVFFVRVPAMLLGPATESTQSIEDPWFAFIAFEGTIYSIAAAFLLLAMAKERVELRYKTASRTDPLTGVLNRRSFLASAEQVIARASRHDCSVALVLFDLDHFKKINDTLGHQCGDEVLKLFCLIATTHLRPSDMFGRLGGEEFAALLPEADTAIARMVATRILCAFDAAGQSLAHPGLETTASAGIAILEDGRSSFDNLLTAADRALYKAKRDGRNRIVGEAHSSSGIGAAVPAETPSAEHAVVRYGT